MLALAAMRARLVTAPSDGRAAVDWASALRSNGDRLNLTKALRRAAILAPMDGKLRELLFLCGLDRPSQLARLVAEDMVRSLVAMPEGFATHFWGAVMFRNSGRMQWAERLAKRATALEPNHPRSHELLWKIRSNWGWDGKGSIGGFHIPNGHKENDQRFFRAADTRFFPKLLAEFDDIDTILRRDIFYGYIPDRPRIPADKQLIAMGSCFAQHIRQFLLRRGRLSGHVEIPEGLNNTFAIRQFVDWVEGRDELVYSYERTSGGTIERWDLDKERSVFREAFEQAGGFIVTIGVAEVWRDKATGSVFWRGIPADRFDPDRHDHALSTVEQNTENLRAVVDGIRRLAGDVPVVFTLSPVPLIATMRARTSIFAADCVSKSTLRLAIETVVHAAGGDATYWPSFEAFRWLGAHLDRRLYDGEQNARHPSPDMIGRIVNLFVDSYMEPNSRDSSAVT